MYSSEKFLITILISFKANVSPSRKRSKKSPSKKKSPKKEVTVKTERDINLIQVLCDYFTLSVI